MTTSQKHLKDKEAKLLSEITELNMQLSRLKSEKEEKQLALRKVQKQLEGMQVVKPLTITDHCMLRFLERNENLNLSEVRAKLITPELQKIIDTLGGTGKYPLGDGMLVIEDYRLITYTKGKKDS